ncbi:lasso peptide biosynthesis PqqD family chaperone [Streptomyces sp. 4N509B]|uniref:lasso peptide biosynthesis PqqD family chaperone n=1 Tax=Streptomyces sp. 4N509B TaxID=3457413 RepID=UPI003FD3E656
MSLRLSPDVVSCDTDDGLVLLDSRHGRYWQLNATGAAILRALLDGAGARHVAAELARRQPVSAERAARDVDALVAGLTRARLVEGGREAGVAGGGAA